jgi:hypothetical protein
MAEWIILLTVTEGRPWGALLRRGDQLFGSEMPPDLKAHVEGLFGPFDLASPYRFPGVTGTVIQWPGGAVQEFAPGRRAITLEDVKLEDDFS